MDYRWFCALPRHLQTAFVDACAGFAVSTNGWDELTPDERARRERAVEQALDEVTEWKLSR